ncbi:S100P-binding protein isoform 2-T7 [Clarias gariepinus]|uniref:uncharacterized protein LOC128528899 isoform X2 n=1 Tax=Clarias gariepinus TaxID=13013 RepID=UPI00234CB9A5|nr:uncharacterized protein LOC128528899 isoform X2 [Clarias gariepinus]
MEKNRNKKPIKAASSKKPRSVPHLKPLTIYGYRVFNKDFNLSCPSPSWSPDCPSWNLDVELNNIRTSVGQKRRLNVLCLDEKNDMPPKKPCRVSSDSGCVLDSFIQSEDSANGFVLDYNVEKIMCLSPIDRADIGIGGVEDFSPCADTYYEDLEDHSSRYNSGQKQEKVFCNIEGYVTNSYRIANPGGSKPMTESRVTKSGEVHFNEPYKVTVPKLSCDKTRPVSTPIMSTPLNKSKDLVKRLYHRLDLDKENWSSPSEIRVKEDEAASGSQRNVFIDVPRPVLLYREEDWEKEKNVYVESVKRHMTDNMQNGVMSELLHLMDTVANRERGIDGRKWQHPSDLTRRYAGTVRGKEITGHVPMVVFFHWVSGRI